jgi:Fur family zinc uptake transcriptional regulator
MSVPQTASGSARDLKGDIAALAAPAGSGDARSELTPLRRIVLEALVQADRPLGAYAIVTQIETIAGRRVMPASVYRSLEVLLDRGLVIRIESKNAYVANAQPAGSQAGIYFICDHCGVARAIETPALGGLIEHQAAALGFRIGRRVVEMQGVCEQCQHSDINHSTQVPQR